MIEQITPFGVRLRIKSFKHKARNLVEQIEQSKMMVDSMTPEEKAEMYRKPRSFLFALLQGEGWARSEAPWAKDFREGKCKRD